MDDEKTEQIKQLADVLVKTGLTQSSTEAFEKAKQMIEKADDETQKIDVESIPTGEPLTTIPKSEKTPDQKQFIREQKIIENAEQEKLSKHDLEPEQQLEDITPPVDTEKEILPEAAKENIEGIEKLETAFIEDKLAQMEKSLEDWAEDTAQETKQIVKEKINDLKLNKTQLPEEEVKRILQEIQQLIDNLR